MADASTETPSVAYATATFVALLGIPVGIFAAATLWTLNQATQQANWGLLTAAYVLGSGPGIVIGVRYLRTRRSKIAFGVLYPIACLGLLFAEGLLISCAVTNVCL
jgi:hypothetical protein